MRDALDPERRDEILARVAHGELSMDSPQVKDWLESDPTFRQDVEATKAWVADLEHVGGEVESLMAEAKRTMSREDRELVEAFVADQWPSRPHRWTWIHKAVLVSVAAALLTALSFFLLERQPSTPQPPPEDVILSEKLVECVAPRGEGSSFTRFEWRSEILEAGSWHLTIFSMMPDDYGETLLTTTLPPESGNAWTPSQGAIPDSHTHIRWSITRFDASGAIVATDSLEASRD